MSQSFLSQGEVDALLERVDDQPARPPEAAGTRIERYDLAHKQRIVPGRLPGLELIHKRFASHFQASLSGFMQRGLEVAAGPVRTSHYSSFLDGASSPATMSPIVLRPLRGTGLLVCDPQLVSAIVDTMFGGTGRPMTGEQRELSATERRIVRRIAELACTDYRKAWQDVHPLQADCPHPEAEVRPATIAAPTETVAWSRFEVRFGEISGAIRLCLPLTAIEPVLDSLESPEPDMPAAADREWTERLTRQIESVELSLVAELAHAQATVADLLALQAGDFIEFDIGRTLIAKVDGIPLLDCQYGISNGRRALKLASFLNSRQDSQNGAHDDQH